MRLSFSSGLQITVPNDQYMVPFVTIDRNGSRIFNESQREFLMNGVSKDNPPTLGRYFLSSAYLMVNHDADTFTLWQANPSAASQLVPIPGENTNTDACTSTAAAAQPSATDSSGPPPAQPSQGLPGATIAAIAVVSVFVVGFVTLLVLYIRARRRKQDARILAAISAQNFPDKDKDGYRQTRIYEMPPDCRPHEVPGSEHMVYELDGRVIRR